MYRGWTQTDYQNRSTEHSKGNKTVTGKVAKTCTEDGHRLPKQALQYKPKVTTTCTEDGHRLPKQALQYKPKGRRNIGRPRKIWRDQLHLEDQGTGNTPNPSGTWWWWWWCTVQNAERGSPIGRQVQNPVNGWGLELQWFEVCHQEISIFCP